TGTGLDVTRVVLAVELAPAGVDDDGIARLDAEVLLLQRALQVVGRDLVAVAEYLDALEARDVDQHAAGDEGRYVLHAEFREPAARGDVLGLEAVVVAVAMALVRKAVELRADLADLGEHHLLVAAALVGAGIHERALQMHVEAARAEERHAGAEHMRELDDLA